MPFVTSLDALIAERPDVVIEAASHDAVREFARPLIDRTYAFDQLPAAKAYMESDAHLGKIVLRVAQD